MNENSDIIITGADNALRVDGTVDLRPRVIEVNNRGTRRRYFRFIQKQLWKELNARWREQGVGN